MYHSYSFVADALWDMLNSIRQALVNLPEAIATALEAHSIRQTLETLPEAIAMALEVRKGAQAAGQAAAVPTATAATPEGDGKLSHDHFEQCIFLHF